MYEPLGTDPLGKSPPAPFPACGPDTTPDGLARAGFSRVRAWDSAPYWGPESGIGPGCRTIWLARKGKS